MQENNYWLKVFCTALDKSEIKRGDMVIFAAVPQK